MIDCYSGESQFADHIYPIWQALEDPGDFIIEGTIADIPRWPGSVTTATDPTRPVLVASYGDQKKVRRQGRTRIARIEHGAGQSYGTGHGSYAGGKDCDDVSLFLMPNQYSADLWQAAYPDARVEIVGCPKLDGLPRREGPPGNVVCISWHWDCHLVPETVSAFSTFRAALEPLRETFDLIGHGHPRAIDRPPLLRKRYRRLEIPLVAEFEEVCRRADVYVCDNSSSMFEFAATGRPVVVMNATHYRKNVHHGLRFWDAANIGVQVDSASALVDAVHLALEDGPAQKANREQALELVYPIRSGASQRAAAVLEEWAA